MQYNIGRKKALLIIPGQHHTVLRRTRSRQAISTALKRDPALKDTVLKRDPALNNTAYRGIPTVPTEQINHGYSEGVTATPSAHEDRSQLLKGLAGLKVSNCTLQASVPVALSTQKHPA